METDAKIRPPSGLVITKKALIVVGVALLFICLVLSWWFFWKPNQSHSLLPATVAKQITNFTPYFFFDKIPDSYSLDEKNISFDDGVVIMSLTKPHNPTLVLTEQTLPTNLPPNLLQEKDSEKVKNTAAPAIINKVEGRFVGIMTSQEHELLLIINAPGNMRTEDISSFLQALKPVK